MKLTEAQTRLLAATNAVHGGLSIFDLPPATRAMVAPLRSMGLISKRHREQITLTAAGLAALDKKGK